MRAPAGVANFDSAGAMLRALARYLHGKDFPALGVLRPLTPLAPLVNRLPVGAYRWSGAAEGIAPRRLARVRAETIARWVVASYPRRRYPPVRCARHTVAAADGVRAGAAPRRGGRRRSRGGARVGARARAGVPR